MKANTKLGAVKKFYLLDYFYVLLASIKMYSIESEVFEEFKKLKQEFNLGESKYKKIQTESEKLSEPQLKRYKYTFYQVVAEAIEYKLIKVSEIKIYSGDELIYFRYNDFELTKDGITAIEIYNSKGSYEFNRFIFNRMEDTYGAFRYFLDFCYSNNKSKNGLLILPIYSPLKLNINKKDIVTTIDLLRYLDFLQEQLEDDIKQYLGHNIDLEKYKHELIESLASISLIPRDVNKKYKSSDYNKIISRIRRYWLNFFLKKIYKFEYSLTSFETWVYRAKQIGIIHATEFFPGFSGKIIYPISILSRSKSPNDFVNIMNYEDDDNLYLHHPNIDKRNNVEDFVDVLHETYLEQRNRVKSYFINLLDLREVVCYKQRISERIFDEYLTKVYQLDLDGQLRSISISLEGDKLPKETDAMYLKRVPIRIQNKEKNIIAIDFRR